MAILLIDQGAFTQEAWWRQIEVEAGHLQRQLEAKFPGFKATDHGLAVDAPKAAKTTKGWRP